MPREGAIIFRDLVGKLDVLNVECAKCGRRGRYHLHRLIERNYRFINQFGDVSVFRRGQALKTAWERC
jgi:hypothetical protein